MNSVRRPVAILAALLLLTGCSRKAPSETAGATSVDTSPTATANPNSGQAQDQMVRAHLDGYGWVNQASGTVHVPIERAMDLIVARKQSVGPASDPAPVPENRETNTAAQNKGRRLFVQYGCNVCHDPHSPTHDAPSLVGVSGRRVRLSDGSFVLADDKYLRDSIIHSKQLLVAGYGPEMPNYSSVIAEPDVQELVAYLKSLVPAKTP